MADSSARLAGINVGGPARINLSGDFGLIGLAVMGQNLIMNIADHKFTIVAFNRTVAKVDRFLSNEAKGLLMSLVLSLLIMQRDSIYPQITQTLSEPIPWRNSS